MRKIFKKKKIKKNGMENKKNAYLQGALKSEIFPMSSPKGIKTKSLDIC
jgi:hypothetical protein